jgi:hypothetical protein
MFYTHKKIVDDVRHPLKVVQIFVKDKIKLKVDDLKKRFKKVN